MDIWEKMYEEAGMSWADLEAIAEDYTYRVDGFYMIRDMFLKELIENKEDETGLHSYRTRIKTPGHLVEKIIRRRVENYRTYKELTKENYLKFVTDIIGFRGLLLYREDWVVFHKYLLKHFENHASWYVHDCLKDFDESRDRYMVEAPKVHIRPGFHESHIPAGHPPYSFCPERHLPEHPADVCKMMPFRPPFRQDDSTVPKIPSASDSVFCRGKECDDRFLPTPPQTAS